MDGTRNDWIRGQRVGGGAWTRREEGQWINEEKDAEAGTTRRLREEQRFMDVVKEDIK